jgi:hypothetical protein
VFRKILVLVLAFGVGLMVGVSPRGEILAEGGPGMTEHGNCTLTAVYPGPLYGALWTDADGNELYFTIPQEMYSVLEPLEGTVMDLRNMENNDANWPNPPPHFDNGDGSGDRIIPRPN